MGPGQQQKRILIIDDDQDIAITLSMALGDKGFKADSCTNPVLASKNFRENLYDVVILDIKMPISDGFLVYHKIKRVDKKVKIIFLTATEFYYEEIRKERGFDRFNQELFLRKPIHIKDLVHEIRKLLESK